MKLPGPGPVLIVDDDDLIRGILSARLDRLSVPVLTAASAEEALAVMEAVRVGVLVLDLHMPGGSGLDLAEFVRLFGLHLRGVPILVFTGTTPSADTLEQARRLDADVYLKPHGLQALLDRVRVLADPANQMERMDRLASGGDTSNSYIERES